jgi:septum site-determining protein MinD
VTTPDHAALQDVDRVLGILEGEGRTNAGLVINRVRPDLARRGDALTVAQVLDVLAIDLLGIVPESEHVIASNGRGVPIAHEADTLPGRAYQNIARRLLGEPVPFISLLEGKPTFWQRIGLARRPSAPQRD